MQTVVVADSHTDNRESLAMLLASCPFFIVEADEGQRAFEDALSTRALALVIDYDLANADLAEIVHRLRETRGRDIFLAMTTAWDPKVRPGPAGLDLQLTKPFPANDLLTPLLAHALRASNRTRSGADALARAKHAD